MEIIKITISRSAGAERLDKQVALHDANLSRRQIKRFIDMGSVFVDGKRIRKASYQVVPPAVIEIRIEQNEEIENKGNQIHWSNLLVYKDENLLAINKPAGIPTAPTRDSAVHNVYHYLKKSGILPSKFYPFHRLDKDTSGLLLIPLTHQMAQSLNSQMQNRQIRKTYVAICQGNPTNSDWTVQGKISRSRRNSNFFKFTSQPEQNHVNSMSEFHLINQHQNPDLCLIEANPFTGRTHQIRLHLAFSSLPILGDPRYNLNPMPAAELNIPGQAYRVFLHCRKMSFYHPVKKNNFSLTAPLPEEFRQLIRIFFPEYSPEINTNEMPPE